MNSIDNNIDETYSKLLESASNIKTVVEEKENTECIDIEKIDNIEQPISTVGVYNPITGDVVVDENNNIKELSNKHFENFVGNTTDLSFDDILNIIPDIKYNKEITDQINDISTINKLIKKKKQGTKILYNELPEFLKNNVKNIIAETAGDGPTLAYLNNSTKLNYATNLIIQTLVDEYDRKNSAIDLDTMLSGFNESIDKLQNDFSKEFGDILMNIGEERKAEIDKAIERCKSEGKEDAIEKLQRMKNTIDEAYTLDKFSEYCKKVKIKKFDIEKPKKIFLSFNAKYLKHDNNINDINYCPIILDRHIDDHKSNIKVCIAFCKYCLNFSPDNIEEHTFMYYFIRNIILIDRINPKGKLYESMNEKSKEFYNGFISNIKKCINNINDRK